MEKRFCDICEAPAEKFADLVQFKRPVGETYQAYKSDTSGGVQGLWQCKIVVKPVITFEDHKAGFGGPPDLCRNCLKGLLIKLVDSVQGQQ